MNEALRDRLLVKLFGQEDLEDAAQAEKLCFSDPWSREAMTYLVCRPSMASLCLRDKETGALVAYGGLSYAADEAELVNIAVVPGYRRMGIAAYLLEFFRAYAEKEGMSVIYLEVRENNEAARKLYLSNGYEEYGIRKNYYKNPTEDAVLMKLCIQREN